MGPRVPSSSVRAGVAVWLTAAVALVLSACSSGSTGEADLVNGKKQFAAKCGSCHTLSRAESKGTAGPDLDQAFQQALKDGMPRSGVRGVIYDQILYPSNFEHEGGKRADGSAAMPAKIVTGDNARDVAAYVASVAARPGKDTGLVGEAVKKAGGGAPAAAKGGTLSIPADPGGQLAYATNQASAPPGKLTVEMPNKSGTPHDIVIDGKGKGEVVKDGGVSKFEASFAAGSYTYYCSVPGHKEAGMQGKLTVK